MKWNTSPSSPACLRGVVGSLAGSTAIRTHRRYTSLSGKGLGKGELIDRLMISSLIEARSCERFHLLAGALRGCGNREIVQGALGQRARSLSFVSAVGRSDRAGGCCCTSGGTKCSISKRGLFRNRRPDLGCIARRSNHTGNFKPEPPRRNRSRRRRAGFFRVGCRRTRSDAYGSGSGVKSVLMGNV